MVEYIRLIEPSRRRRLLALVGLAFLASLLETAAALAIYTLVGTLTAPGNAPALPLIGEVSAYVPGTGDEEIFYLTVAIAAFFLLRGVYVVFQTYAQARVAHNAGVELATRLLDRYLRMPYRRFVDLDASLFVRNIHDSVNESVTFFLLPIVSLSSEAIVVLGIGIILAVVSPVAFLLALTFLGITVLLVMRFIRPRIGALGRQNQVLKAQGIKALNDIPSSFREIRSLGREDYFLAHYGHLRRRLSSVMYLRSTYTEAPKAVIETALVFVLLGFITYVVVVDGSPADTLATLGLFGYAALRILPSVNRSISYANLIRYGESAVDELLAALDTPMEPPKGTRPVASAGSGDPPLVEVSSVTFDFEGRAGPVLTEVSLSIHRGEFVAIVGETGSGKSTLLDLLAGLLLPTDGEIRVSGRPLGSVRDWGGGLAFVSQDVSLVDDSLASNVAFGVAEAEIDRALVARALSDAQLTDLLAELPDGLGTRLGGRGIAISGGQRQRVAIARALYAQPQILLMDEGTSALDLATEMAIWKRLREVPFPETVVAVSHRIETLRQFDRVVVVQDGVIESQGPYDQVSAESQALRRIQRATRSPRAKG